MRIAGVNDEDPWDHRTWSGSSRYFFQALQDAGLLAGAVSAQPSKILERLYQLKNFSTDMERWRFKYHLDTGLAGVRTRSAHASLAKAGFDYDCILQVGAWYDMTESGCRVVSYHDGNLARRIDNPYGHPPIGRRSIDKALRYERDVYSKIDTIFTMSRWLADSFVRDFCVESSKVVPVYAGINMPDIDEFTPANYASKNLIFVGKQFERKGGRVLLEAFAKVRRQIKGATLTIVGPELSHLPEGVINPGFISKADAQGLQALQELLRNAAAFVLPTLYEPFGISFVEAMAHGLPCVGTNICAVPEIIEHGRTGYVVAPGDVDALAARLCSLLGDPSACADFGVAGFAAYRERFRWSAVATRIKDCLAATYGK